MQENNNLDMDLILKEYQLVIGRLSNENIMMNVVIKQLQTELEQAKAELEKSVNPE
jgi:hypothetical protein